MEREAKPAPHGIVQALFNKRRVPELSTRVSVKEIDATSDLINILIQNKSVIPAEKVSFIVEIYNIASLNSAHDFEFLPDVLRDKYSMSNHSDQVLVRVIGIPIEIEVQHKGDDYLIFIGYWCKDRDFDFKFGSYNPNINEFVSKGSFSDGTLLTEEIERIKNKTLPNNSQ